MLTQKKIEIGQQQSDLMDKLAKRRGKQLKKRNQEEIEQRKAEILNPNKEIVQKDTELGDLDDFLQIAKDIIDDQNLVSLLQRSLGD
jgi:hypothetical protein